MPFYITCDGCRSFTREMNHRELELWSKKKEKFICPDCEKRISVAEKEITRMIDQFKKDADSMRIKFNEEMAQTMERVAREALKVGEESGESDRGNTG